MKTTIELAREVYGAHTEWTGAPLDRLEQLVALVRADEREACAKLVEPDEEHRRDASWGYIGGEDGVELLDGKAADIRARGETK
jgi:hypothetical protein